MIEINIRWWGGYYESFECSQVHFGSDLLWVRLADERNCHNTRIA